MKVVPSIDELRAARSDLGEIGFVPTMGALHAGHLSLVEVARREAGRVVASVFVNPTQFNSADDLSRYPRPLEDDLRQLEEAGVDLVFTPDAEVMYPPGEPEILIDLPRLTKVLEGKHRPGHFQGVCQVVAKLFNLVSPQVAVFGRKDFQQLRVIEAMVEALNFPVRIIPAETMREPDGLAMSSRNRHLTPEDRQRAVVISKALAQAKAEVRSGITQTNRLIATMQRTLLEKHLAIDYVAAVNPVTFENVDRVDRSVLLAIAARVGKTRLIDNTLVEP